MSPTKFAPAELLVRQSIQQMTPAQFDAYDAALRRTDYDSLPPTDQENFALAVRAANERRSAEARGLDVTVSQASGISIPQEWLWIGGAVFLALLIANR